MLGKKQNRVSWLIMCVPLMGKTLFLWSLSFFIAAQTP